MNNKIENINEIFNEINLDPKASDLSDMGSRKVKLTDDDFFTGSTQKFESIEAAVDAAIKCQEKWKSETPINRSMALDKVSKHLTKNSYSYLNKQWFDESEYSLLAGYFNTYSDLATQIGEIGGWAPLGNIYLQLNDSPPIFFITAIVAAAVASGCCIVIHEVDEESWFSLFLASVFKFEGLPEGLINVVTKPNQNFLVLEKFQKVIFYGSHKEAQEFYTNNFSPLFSFFCPNNTSALVLESSDISAAVEKLLYETWHPLSSKMWGVSTVVVQESISQEFLEKLEKCLDQFNHVDYSSTLHQKKFEEMDKIITKATKAGGIIMQSSYSKGERCPTVIVNYQDQNSDLDIPILKILTCRTFAEGIALINNCRFSLGTSIWSEHLSGALEVASKLMSKNIWLNCHGVVEPGITTQSFGCSGNFTFGGKDGILEFITVKSVSFGKSVASKEVEVSEKVNVWSAISAAQRAFTMWGCEKNRKKYLIDIASLLEKNKEHSNFAHIFKQHSCFTNISESLGNQSSEQFDVIFKKEPVGVIGVIINSFSNFDKIISLISLAIAFGNTIILVLEKNYLALQLVTDCLTKILPNNVVNVIVGSQVVTELASSSVVQGLWFYDLHLSPEYLQKIRNQAGHNLKQILMIPKTMSDSLGILKKECTKSKIIWLSKIDRLPNQ